MTLEISAAVLSEAQVEHGPHRREMLARSKAELDSVVELARQGITSHVTVNSTGAHPYLIHLLLLVTATHVLLVDFDYHEKTLAVRWTMPSASFLGARASSHGVLVWSNVAAVDNWLSSDRDSAERSTYRIPCEDAKVVNAICRVLRPLQPLALP